MAGTPGTTVCKPTSFLAGTPSMAGTPGTNMASWYVSLARQAHSGSEAAGNYAIMQLVR